LNLYSSLIIFTIYYWAIIYCIPISIPFYYYW